MYSHALEEQGPMICHSPAIDARSAPFPALWQHAELLVCLSHPEPTETFRSKQTVAKL